MEHFRLITPAIQKVDDDFFMIRVLSLFDKMKQFSIEQIFMPNIHKNNKV